MNRLTRPLPTPWSERFRDTSSPRQSSPRADAPPFATRPGIAARWKPRDRVRAAGN